MPDIVQAGQNYADAAGRLLTGRANIEANRLTGKTNALLGAIEPITKALTPLNEDQKLAQRMTIEEAKLKRQAVIDEATDNAALQSAIKTHLRPDGTPDLQGVTQALAAYPRALMKWTAHLDEVKKAGLQQQELDLKNKTSLATLLAQNFDGVDQASYPDAFKRGVALDPSLAQHLDPNTFDPVKVGNVVRAGSLVKETNDQIRESQKELLSGNRQLGAARLLYASQAAGPNQAAWEDTLHNLDLNAPEEAQKWRAVPFGPDAMLAAKKASLTTEQQVTAEGAQETRIQTAKNQAAEREQAAAALRNTLSNQMQQHAFQQHTANVEDARLALAQREQALKEQEAAATKGADITPDLDTTQTGRKYLDLSKLNMKERPAMREKALAAGIPVIADKASTAKLKDIDQARLNQAAVMADIESSLPKDSAGRIISAPGILLSKALQTSEQRAAFNSWRTTAIGTLRALAGGAGSGLRINQAEILMSVANDIPQLTDTIATARYKMANIKKQLDNSELAILGAPKGGSAGGGSASDYVYDPVSGTLKKKGG